MSPQKFNTADDEGPNPALTPHQEGLIVGSPPPDTGQNADGAGTVPAARSQPPARPKPPAMTRRSWYVEKAAADRLVDVVDELFLHFGARVPKHVIASELFHEAADRVDVVKTALEKTRTPHTRSTQRTRSSRDTRATSDT